MLKMCFEYWKQCTKMHLAAKLCRWMESNFCPTCLDLFISFIRLYLAVFYYSFLSSLPIEERKAVLIVRYANLFSQNLSRPFFFALICIFNIQPWATSHLAKVGFSGDDEALHCEGGGPLSLFLCVSTCLCVFPAFSTSFCFPPLPSSYLTAEHNKRSFIYT